MKTKSPIFSLLIKLGVFFERILDRTSHLKRTIDEHLMLHNLYEHFKVDDTEKNIQENISRLEKIVDVEVKEINKMIKAANRIFTNTVWKKKLPPVNQKELNKLFKIRFKEIYNNEVSQKLSNENFRIKLNKILTELQESFSDFFETVDKEYSFEGFEKLEKKYREGINSAIGIFSIASFRTSIFVVGRTIEDILDDLLRLSIKTKKLKRFSIPNTRYEDKIGRLKSVGVIDEKLFHDLNSIRIDRNKSGHPLRRKFSFEEAKITISKGVEILLKLQKKLRV